MKIGTPTLGVIVGNRGFFPAHLAESGRKTILEVLEQEGINAVCLTPEDTQFGSIVSHSDSEKCADLFKQHREEIIGILVTLPNFGEEKAIANAIRWSGLDVPVLIQATPDDPLKMSIADRRDSFCGKMSACNNLRQYGIDYTLTTTHTVDPTSDEFRADLREFVSTCRVVNGLRNGARRRDRRTTRRVQHRALQREAAGTLRHLRRDAGPVGSVRAHRQDVERGRSRQGQARADQRLRGRAQHACRVADEDGEVRRGGGRLDGRESPGGERHPVLDLDGRVLRHRPLHANEPDEQRPAALGL